jgi:D-xylose reductase
LINALLTARAQVVLRWGVQRGYNLVPKSTQVTRLKENIDVFDFELSADDVAAISALNRNRRFNDPGVYTKFWNQFYPIFA